MPFHQFSKVTRYSLLTAIYACSSLLLSCASQQQVSTQEANTAVSADISLPVTKFSNPPQLNIKQEFGTCGSEEVQMQPLVQPQEISPDLRTGILQTELVVRIKERCIPVWVTSSNDSTTGKWEWQVKKLRTYGFPIDHSKPINPSNPDDPNIAWSAPGPTLVLHPSTGPDAQNGSKFKMKLHNYMPTQPSYNDCNPIPDNNRSNGAGTDPSYSHPNCFHGDNVTNFHFHGFHISPQAHQDYVLLSLLPHGAVDDGHSAHSRGDTAIGDYSYNVPAIPWNQAPGTHWYHAHKHGATALQVLNGLVGTFRVHGEFDRKLEKHYADKNQKLEDRLMVVQQLEEQLPGLGGTKAQYPLINGQANPVVVMKPGEVQRWRFVGATMQASAQLSIGFEEEFNGALPDPLVRQIAMDGVQFAPENYECQTLINGPDCVDTNDAYPGDFTLNPGNRIDLLVKAPSEPGTYYMTHRVVAELNMPDLESIEVRKAAITKITGTENPPLLTLVIQGDTNMGMEFPTKAEFPELPSYLDDIKESAAIPERNIVYQMNDKRGTFDKVAFAINDKQYDPSCVNESFVLGEPQTWNLENNSSIAHPFHIHTNPFQLLSETSYDATTGETIVTQYKPPYIWQDTLAIPVASTKGEKPNGKATIRYEALNFTGEFVNHCHILGHEDRGMMQNVQATCSNGKWGEPTFDGSAECKNPVVEPPPMCVQ